MKLFIKIFLIFLIFLILFNTLCFGANTNTTFYQNLDNYKVDPNEYILNWQKNLQASMFNALYSRIGSSLNDISSLDDVWQDIINNILRTDLGLYVIYQNNRYFLMFYNTMSFDESLDGSSYEGTLDISYNNTSLVSVPTVLHPFHSFYQAGFSTYGKPTTFTGKTPLPDSCMYLFTESRQNFIDLYNKTTFSDIANAINKNNELIEQTNEKLQENNDFLSEDIKEEDIDTSLPSVDSSTDITSEGVDSIFNAITNGINNKSPIQFEILGEQVSISSTSLSDNLPETIVSILNLFWWFFISYRIFKDIINIFEKVTTGEIDKVDTTNVKADLF